MIRLSVILPAAVLLLVTGRSSAQSFIGNGTVAYDPEIATVSSGVVLDVQPVVSQDNRYVTINMQVQDSRLIALHNFQIANAGAAGPARGFVGGVMPVAGSGATVMSSSPAEINRLAIASRSVLSRRGMFLLRVN